MVKCQLPAEHYYVHGVGTPSSESLGGRYPCMTWESAHCFAGAVFSTIAGGNFRQADQFVEVAQRRECSRKIEPYATQDTAWRRWREAQRGGYAVSNGIYICYDEYGTRGYCFNIFFPC